MNEADNLTTSIMYAYHFLRFQSRIMYINGTIELCITLGSMVTVTFEFIERYALFTCTFGSSLK